MVGEVRFDGVFQGRLLLRLGLEGLPNFTPGILLL